MTITRRANVDAIAMRPFDESLPMALLRARESAMRHFRPLLAQHDLTEQQWRVLRALAAADKPVEVSHLAEHTFLLAPSLSRILANLESRSFLSRHPVAHDQRRAAIALTADGMRLVQRIAPASEASYNLIEEQFGSDRLRRLMGELHVLAEVADPATMITEEAS